MCSYCFFFLTARPPLSAIKLKKLLAADEFLKRYNDHLNTLSVQFVGMSSWSPFILFCELLVPAPAVNQDVLLE